jgi:hypothetical protein
MQGSPAKPIHPLTTSPRLRAGRDLAQVTESERNALSDDRIIVVRATETTAHHAVAAASHALAQVVDLLESVDRRWNSLHSRLQLKSQV